MRRVTKYPRYHSNCTPAGEYHSSGSNKPYALTRQSREGSNPAGKAVSSFQLRSYKRSVPSRWLAPTATSLRAFPAVLSVIVFVLFDCGSILPYRAPEVKKKFHCPGAFRPPQRAEQNPIRVFRRHARRKTHSAHGALRLFRRNRGAPRVKSPSSKRLRLLLDDSFLSGHAPDKNTLTQPPWAAPPVRTLARGEVEGGRSPPSMSHSLLRMIFPLMVLGSSSRNTTIRGYL